MFFRTRKTNFAAMSTLILQYSKCMNIITDILKIFQPKLYHLYKDASEFSPALILKKGVLIVFNHGLKSYFKMLFCEYLRERTLNIFPQSLYFMCCRCNIYESALISRNLLPWKLSGCPPGLRCLTQWLLLYLQHLFK